MKPRISVYFRIFAAHGACPQSSRMARLLTARGRYTNTCRNEFESCSAYWNSLVVAEAGAIIGNPAG
jgi:hypothetical protein